MYRVGLLFILLSFLFSCSKDDSIGNLPKEKQLESFTAYAIPYKYGVPSRSSKFLWESETYNLDGTIKKRKYHSSSDIEDDTNFLYTETNTYENGLLKEQIEFKISRYRKVFDYEGSNLMRIDVYSENGLINKYEYKYLGNSPKPFELDYWGGAYDKTPTIHTYSYDANWNMIEDVINYNSTSVTNSVLSWEYDSFNNMTREYYRSEGSDKVIVQDIREYIYDEKGNVIQSIFPSFYTIIFQKYVYQYLENGFISKIDVYKSMDGIDGNYKQTGIIEYEYIY